MFVFNSLTEDFIALAVTFLVVAIAYCKWQYQYWRRRNVPYLEPQIPFGNVKDTIRGKEQISVTSKKLYDKMKSKGWKHAGIFVLTKPHYFPLDLDIIKNILTKDFQYFIDRDVFYNEKDPLSAHLVNVSGNQWKSLRSKLTPTFTSGKMKMMFHIMVECQNDLQKRLEHESSKNEPINIKEILACYTTNVIGSCAFGLDCKALEDDDSDFRKMGKKLFEPSTWLRLKQTLLQTFPTAAKFLNLTTTNMEVANFFLKMVNDTMDYRVKHDYKRNDFMQMMIKLNQEPKDGPFTLEDITTQCVVFFAAGFETSSTLMTFALYEMGKNQKIQEKLREEINTVLAKYDNELSYEAIQEMTYLNQVIEESLRMHPPGGTTNRRCVKDYKVPDQDLIIKKGTTVTISILGIHYDEEYYSDPTKFDPERFDEENKSSRHHYSFLPFGEGPRNCIGMRFGMLQAKVGLVSVIKNYKITVNKKTQEPISYQPGSVVLAIEGELWVNAEKI